MDENPIENVNKDVNPRNTSVIETAREQSFQSRATAEPLGGLSVVWWATKAGLNVSPWWSKQRDIDLRKFWKQPDYLAGAVYAMESKMSAIPFTIIPVDTSNKQHVAQAQEIQENLIGGAEYGDGWVSFYGKYVEDLLTTDNGQMAEIIGPGDPSGPIVGAPLTVSHLDSSRCIRTGSPEFPIVYTDLDGRMYKLHYTRVMFNSQMTSPISEMYGVGFCAISRCLNVSQTLLDILTFKQEKLGSRPHRNVLVARGGLDPNDIKAAFEIAESEISAKGLSRYSRTVVVGSSSILEADIKQIDMASLPDGFNEEMSVTLGMAAIALAFGVDARELFPAMGAGATRADALLQHLKQRGKGPGQIIQSTETQFNHKFLPPHLRMVFDFQDDAQDRQVAEIQNIRSNYRGVQLKFGAVNTRVARERMLQDGDIDRGQFEELELADGRLEDGAPVESLFYSSDPKLTKYLNLGVPEPTNIYKNAPATILPIVMDKKVLVNKDLANEKDFVARSFMNRALAALTALEETYKSLVQELQQAQPNPAEGQPSPNRIDDTRVRTLDLTQPTTVNDLAPANQIAQDNSMRTNAGDKTTEKEKQVQVEPFRYRIERDILGNIIGIVEEANQVENTFEVIRDGSGSIVEIKEKGKTSN